MSIFGRNADGEKDEIARKAAREALRKAGPQLLQMRREDFIVGFKWGYKRGGPYMLNDEQLKSFAEEDSRLAFPDSILDSLGDTK